MNWQPSASIEVLKKRADMLSRVRQFFVTRGYLEVDTPILTHFGITDFYIEQLKTSCMGTTCYLQTSPEYPMKRLLAAGSGPIFQLAKVFRNEEKGRWHEPEFTLLEWYQLNIDHHELMHEVDVFLQTFLESQPLVKKTYEEVFESYLQINPHHATIQELREGLHRYDLLNVVSEEEQDRDLYLFLLMSHVIEPNLGRLPYPTAVYDFPKTQAALSRIDKDKAQRFEIYYQGVELANGFFELQDPKIQLERFQQDRQKRRLAGLPEVVVDERFLAALSSGLPACSGVALGIDRLFALVLGQKTIQSVVAFDFERV